MPLLMLLHRLRVVRTYKPGQNGAKRLTQSFGRQLVCVRHRVNASQTRRYTTVELVVESFPIRRQSSLQVALRIPHSDQVTRALLMANGAKWRVATQSWIVSRATARKLRLMRFALDADWQDK